MGEFKGEYWCFQMKTKMLAFFFDSLSKVFQTVYA